MKKRKKYVDLCARCQHRAEFLDTRKPMAPTPRMECMSGGKVSCYAYVPVKPLRLEKWNRRDPRPIGGGMLGSAVLGTENADLALHIVQEKSGVTPWWGPRK